MMYYLLIGMVIAVYWMVTREDAVADSLELARQDMNVSELTAGTKTMLLLVMFTTITVLWPNRLLNDLRGGE